MLRENQHDKVTSGNSIVYVPITDAREAAMASSHAKYTKAGKQTARRVARAVKAEAAARRAVDSES